MSASINTVSSPLIDQIEARQSDLGLSDKQLCEAVGFDREIVFSLIKAGTMRLPLNRIPALAKALSLSPAPLLRSALLEGHPELLAVIEEVFNPMNLTDTEVRLLQHLRSLAGDQPVVPIVFDGKGVIALVGVPA